MIPARDEARSLLLVKAVVDGDFMGACCGHELFQMGDGVRFRNAGGEEAVEFPVWVQEVVVRVDDEDGGVSGHCEVWKG